VVYLRSETLSNKEKINVQTASVAKEGETTRCRPSSNRPRMDQLLPTKKVNRDPVEKRKEDRTRAAGASEVACREGVAAGGMKNPVQRGGGRARDAAP